MDTMIMYRQNQRNLKLLRVEARDKDGSLNVLEIGLTPIWSDPYTVKFLIKDSAEEIVI